VSFARSTAAISSWTIGPRASIPAPYRTSPTRGPASYPAMLAIPDAGPFPARQHEPLLGSGHVHVLDDVRGPDLVELCRAAHAKFLPISSHSAAAALLKSRAVIMQLLSTAARAGFGRYS
jgi:hypothetical protein